MLPRKTYEYMRPKCRHVDLFSNEKEKTYLFLYLCHGGKLGKTVHKQILIVIFQEIVLRKRGV